MFHEFGWSQVFERVSQLQAKLAAVRELVDKANIELSNTDALLMIYQTVNES
jgi:hypothetical protein